MRSFVDKAKGKPIDAVIEHVRDGSTVRCFLLPDYHYITLMISGIRVSGQEISVGRYQVTLNKFVTLSDIFRYLKCW